jgi:hypothetical protein
MVYADNVMERRKNLMKTLRRLGFALALIATPVLYLILETAPSGPNW